MAVKFFQALKGRCNLRIYWILQVLNMIRNIYDTMMIRNNIALSGLRNFAYILIQGEVRRGGLHPGLRVLHAFGSMGDNADFKEPSHN